MSRISGHSTGNEGIDRSLAELAEVLLNKRIGELDDAFAEGNVPYEQAKWRVTAAGHMARRYAENARCLRCRYEYHHA